jgi:hypothetical protein
MGLFGNKEERAAKEAAGAAAVERLEALSVDRLPAEILPGLKRLLEMIKAALEKMTAAGLLTRRVSGVGTGAQTFKLSPFGEEALADGSSEQRLAAG